jgi:succinyl-diaminopimelate desuccinylase
MNASIEQDPVIALLCELIRRKSVTPDDAGCQKILGERLEQIGFRCESLRFADVDNLWARRGDSGPVLCFAGHTDVVPAASDDGWESDPFEPTIRDGRLYGRGSADMKSGLAAMIVALERFVARHPNHNGSLAMLVTSDEEGRARDGTLKVIETLDVRDEKIDWCVLGEPSSQNVLGDTVRIGRRGSLSGMLTVKGMQGHVAYPQLADNPIRRFAPVLAELHDTKWDDGNEHFPPTSFQVVDIRSGVGAPNVTPGELSARFNFRYSTAWNHESLKAKVHEVFDAHEIDYVLDWHLSGEPFITKAGKLTEVVRQVVGEEIGRTPELSTGGGTSDGRFISPAGIDVIELGPVNESIHKVNEHVSLSDMPKLTKMYQRIMELMLL